MEWREYDFFLFSVGSKCENCYHYVAANVAAIYDEQKNSKASLCDYSNQDGELKQSAYLLIDFDCPPLMPPAVVGGEEMLDFNYLFEQAEKCYSIRAWDAVCVLCRKIVEFGTSKLWRRVRGRAKLPGLAERLKELFVNSSVDLNRPLENQLNFNDPKHRMLYGGNHIRILGNEAAHEHAYVFNEEDAESALAFTGSFLEEFYVLQKITLKNKRRRKNRESRNDKR